MGPFNSSSPSLNRQSYLVYPGESTDDNDLSSGNHPQGADVWIDRAGGVIDIYRSVRCAIKPTAPGCQPTQPDVYVGAPQKDYTWVIIGSVAALLIVVLIIIFALKR